MIAAGEGRRDYTISTSALELLRTLDSDHHSQQPLGGDQLIKCCGMLLMSSCPAGIDWSVRHFEGRLRLSDVVRSDSFPSGARIPTLVAELTEDEYAQQITAFAEKAKQPFQGAHKEVDEVDLKLWNDFWQEYDERLQRALSK